MENTSGFGFAIEDLVGAYLAAAMLARKPVIGGLGPPVRIDFQVAVDGWALDDVLVRFRRQDGGIRRWAVSVKSGQQISSVASRDFVDKAWNELLGRTRSGFNPDTDLVGLAIPSLHANTKKGLDDLVRKATYQDPSDIDRRIDQPGYVSDAKRKLWESFCGPGDSDTFSSSPGELLKRFRYLDLDFNTADSLAKDTAVEWCYEAVGSTDDGRSFWSALLEEVTNVRTAGGFIDVPTLKRNLGYRFSFRSDTRIESYLERPQRQSTAPLAESLPPVCQSHIEELARVSPGVATRVATLLSNPSSRTPGILIDLVDKPPVWLSEANALAWEAISDFMDAHELGGSDAAQWRAIEAGSTRRPLYVIRRAVAMAEEGDIEGAKEMLDGLPSDYPLLAVAKARIAEDASAVMDAVERLWTQ